MKTFSKACFSKSDGFTLIEILVALFLVSLILVTVAYNTSAFSPHTRLLETFDNLERAVRFCRDEAILRNRIIRLNIDLQLEDEQSFVVEYAPEADFVMSSAMISDSKIANAISEEELEKRKSKFNKAFQPVREFSEESEKINSNVRVIGVGTSLTSTLQLMGSNGQIFFYPSGEKDATVIILGTDEEIATLKIEPFTMDFERTFYPIEDEYDDILEFYFTRAKGLYEEWLKS